MAFDITPGFSLTNAVKSIIGSTGGIGAGNTGNLSNMKPDSRGVDTNMVTVPDGWNKDKAQTLGAKTSSGNYTAGDGGGGGGGADYSAEIGQISAQDQLLANMLAKLQGSYGQGYANIDDSYSSSKNKATGQHGRAMEDFGTKLNDTELGRDQAIGKVDQNARTLADSLRRMLGVASGSGSSAYQLTAPDAVTRKASLERGDVQTDFGQNFRDIDVGKKRTEEDFGTLLEELASQRNTARRDFETGLGEQINQVQGQRHDLATQRAAYAGGNAAQVAAAGAPIRNDINSREQQLASLFDKYRTPVQARELKVDPVNLRDYTVDRAAIGSSAPAQPSGDATSNYANPFQQKKEDDQLL